MLEPEKPISAPVVKQSPPPAPGAHGPHVAPTGHPYPPPGYPPYPYHIYPPRPPTNGLAIAALVVSVCSVFAACVFYFIPGLLGAVGATMGHYARKQIRSTGEGGDGLALAGVIVGWIITGLALLGLFAVVGFFWWVTAHPPEPTY